MATPPRIPLCGGVPHLARRVAQLLSTTQNLPRPLGGRRDTREVLLVTSFCYIIQTTDSASSLYACLAARPPAPVCTR